MVGGRPDQSLADCLLGSISEGACDSFIDEECDYWGEETGFSPPAGEITNVEECEELCRGFQVRFDYE